MRSPKSSDSPTGYDREIQPRKRVATLAEHEAELRRIENDRWARKLQACLPVVNPGPCDFEGCVE